MAERPLVEWPALLPCPFCGDEPHVYEASFLGDNYQVGCNCGADENNDEPGACWRNGKTPEEAAEYWNRRDAELPPVDAGNAERALADAILAELARARAKFPGDNVTTLALVEEVGELAKATFEESRARVRNEAIQVATMAMRVVLDGDSTLDRWRAAKELDPLLPQPAEVAHPPTERVV